MKLAALNEDWSDESSSEPTEERVKEARVYHELKHLAIKTKASQQLSN